MANKDNMKTMGIVAGEDVTVEQYRMSDGGLEQNIQDEFEFRIEDLILSRVVTQPLFSETERSLSWNPANSLKLYLSGGDLAVRAGVGYVGGKRYVRSTDGVIESSGDPGSGADTYYVYLKYDASADEFDWNYETDPDAASDSSSTKYLLLGTADTDGSTWTDTTDLRTSNTLLEPDILISGGTANHILKLEQTSSGKSLISVGGDIQFGTGSTGSGAVETVLYGDTDKCLQLQNQSGHNVEFIVNASDELTIQSADGTDDITLNLSDISVTNGISTATVTASGLINSSAGNMRSDALQLRETTSNPITFGYGTANASVLETVSLSGSQTWDLPDASGTIAVSASGAISLDSATGEITHNSTGYKHIPTGGSSSQILVNTGTPDNASWVNMGGDVSIAADGTTTFADTVEVSEGGTGATTASGARTNLGVAIGSDVQAYDEDLADIAGMTPTDSNFLVGNGSDWVKESGSTVRDSLGLGTGDNVIFENVTADTDVSVLSNKSLTAANMISVDAQEYVPCKLIGANVSYPFTRADGFIAPAVSGYQKWTFELPLPPRKVFGSDTLDLYVDALRISFPEGTGYHVEEYEIQKYYSTSSNTGRSGVDSATGLSWGSSEGHETSYFTDYNCGGSDADTVRVTIRLNSSLHGDPNAYPRIGVVALRCYYA